MARHDLSIGNQTTIAQRLLETYRKKLVSFQKYILKLRKQQEYLLGKAIMTRPMVFFDTPESTMVNSVSKSTVQIRTGTKKQCCNVLAITGDGQKMMAKKFP
jgi:hypothetical protein